MSYWIEGWVEVAFSDEPGEDRLWQAIINLSPLILQYDEVSERLFALSKRCTLGEYDPGALAPNRGVPADASPEAKWEKQKNDDEFDSEQIGGYTFAFWSEVKEVALPEETLSASEWNLVFRLAGELERKYKGENIRFVVWFVW